MRESPARCGRLGRSAAVQLKCRLEYNEITKIAYYRFCHMCSIDKSIDKVSRYFWYRDTEKYRGIHDTSIVKFWYRNISKYRQYRPSLMRTAECPGRQAAIEVCDCAAIRMQTQIRRMIYICAVIGLHNNSLKVIKD